jgi:hypothetical protein
VAAPVGGLGALGSLALAEGAFDPADAVAELAAGVALGLTDRVVGVAVKEVVAPAVADAVDGNGVISDGLDGDGADSDSEEGGAADGAVLVLVSVAGAATVLEVTELDGAGDAGCAGDPGGVGVVES